MKNEATLKKFEYFGLYLRQKLFDGQQINVPMFDQPAYAN